MKEKERTVVSDHGFWIWDKDGYAVMWVSEGDTITLKRVRRKQ